MLGVPVPYRLWHIEEDPVFVARASIRLGLLHCVSAHAHAIVRLYLGGLISDQHLLEAAVQGIVVSSSWQDWTACGTDQKGHPDPLQLI